VDTDPEQGPLDAARRAAGFLTVRQVAALAPEVRVLDPASVLIGVGVSVLPGVELYPSTTLETRHGGVITLAAGARLGPGPVTVVASASAVHIGEDAELGPGPVTIVADGSDVVIGGRARLTAGCLVEGPARIGEGAQVLGPVSLRDVELADGGDHREPDPDHRGAWSRAWGRCVVSAWDSVRSWSVGWRTPVKRPIGRGSSVSARTTRTRRVVRADRRTRSLSTAHPRAGGQPAPGRAASGRTTRAGRPHGPRGTTG